LVIRASAMDFQQRLAKAAERGHHLSEEQKRAKERHELSEEELKRLHSQYRLPLSERIESCLKQLTDHFPGFAYGPVMNDRGWGAAVSRDDVGPGPGGKRSNFFSRLEMAVRPFSSLHVLELTAKGAIRNKEVYNRTHYQRLNEADPETFAHMIEMWVLEYAELYAAKT
jgi:hypothetical protein